MKRIKYLLLSTVFIFLALACSSSNAYAQDAGSCVTGSARIDMKFSRPLGLGEIVTCYAESRSGCQPCCKGGDCNNRYPVKTSCQTGENGTGCTLTEIDCFCAPQTVTCYLNNGTQIQSDSQPQAYNNQSKKSVVLGANDQPACTESVTTHNPDTTTTGPCTLPPPPAIVAQPPDNTSQPPGGQSSGPPDTSDRCQENVTKCGTGTDTCSGGRCEGGVCKTCTPDTKTPDCIINVTQCDNKGSTDTKCKQGMCGTNNTCSTCTPPPKTPPPSLPPTTPPVPSPTIKTTTITQPPTTNLSNKSTKVVNQKTIQSQFFVCLDSIKCSETGSSCIATFDKKEHVAKLSASTNQNQSLHPGIDATILECIETKEGRRCTTGNNTKDYDLLGLNSFNELNTKFGYSFVGFYDSLGTKNSNNNVIKTPNSSTIGYWDSRTTTQVGRIFMALYNFNGSDYSDQIAAQQQGQLDFETAQKKCIQIYWDPYGFVFDANNMKPVPNAQVELYVKSSIGSFEKYVGRDILNIINPQLSSKDGSYNFQVPNGTYRLKVTAPNYVFLPNPLTSEMYENIYYGGDITQFNKPVRTDIPLYPVYGPINPNPEK
ncbi:MAG: carboxypeptidase-like regulatory domain-containing protein [Candidatus Roizmanbacteria bacterium]